MSAHVSAQVSWPVCDDCLCVQASDLDRIEVSVVQSGVDVKDGNEQVRSVS